MRSLTASPVGEIEITPASASAATQASPRGAKQRSAPARSLYPSRTRRRGSLNGPSKARKSPSTDRRTSANSAPLCKFFVRFARLMTIALPRQALKSWFCLHRSGRDHHLRCRDWRDPAFGLTWSRRRHYIRIGARTNIQTVVLTMRRRISLISATT